MAKHRMVVRAPENPLDRSTVVSIFPLEITENKATIFPSRFTIPPGTVKKPGVLVIKPSSNWRDVDPERPIEIIPEPSVIIAKALVQDFANGLMECDGNGKVPGLFWVIGEKTSADILKDHQDLLEQYEQKQRNWFQSLCSLTDALWAERPNPRVVSELVKIAATELNLDKPWMRDFKDMKMSPCPACGELRDEMYPVCRHCHTVVDTVKYNAGKFKVAS
jgi:hypothetical protein